MTYSNIQVCHLISGHLSTHDLVCELGLFMLEVLQAARGRRSMIHEYVNNLAHYRWICVPCTHICMMCEPQRHQRFAHTEVVPVPRSGDTLFPFHAPEGRCCSSGMLFPFHSRCSQGDVPHSGGTSGLWFRSMLRWDVPVWSCVKLKHGCDAWAARG